MAATSFSPLRPGVLMSARRSPPSADGSDDFACSSEVITSDTWLATRTAQLCLLAKVLSAAAILMSRPARDALDSLSQ